jgi:V/A-type H+-transporting ATPase subunit D
MEAYGALRTAYLTLGYSRLQSQAFTVTPLEAKVRLRSVMGVLVPEIVQRKKSTLSSITDPSAYAAAQQLTESMSKLLTLAEAEARIESIAQELMLTNRKVNALERVILPKIQETLRYIEGRLEEETLEEFFRAKRVKAVIRGHK